MKVRSIALLLFTFLDLASPPVSANDGKVWAAYKAKLVCSGVFVSHRNLSDVSKYDVGTFDFPTQVDRVHGRVVTQWEREDVVAVYRGPKLGCTVLPDGLKLDTRSLLPALPLSPISPAPWPAGEGNMTDSLSPESKAQLDAFLDHEFSEEDANQPKRNTRAIVVIHRGRIIAERYAENIGITKETPLIGWSMTKSITSALSGIRVEQGALQLNEPLSIDSWKNDERSRITLNHLLQMSSGLDFLEDDTTERVSDVTRMLFLNSDTAHYMLERPLAFKPGTRFNYSTGDSILISHAIRNSFHGDEEKYVRFPWESLFDRIGMKSAVLEQDGTGTFLGGTNLYATPRDWARFGLLYLQNGLWNGERILSQDWIDYTRKSVQNASKEGKFYGAHFWLVDPRKAEPRGIPQDTYLAAGFKGQATFIIPSRDLVVVRMGWTEEEDYKPYDILEAVTKIRISYR